MKERFLRGARLLLANLVVLTMLLSIVPVQHSVAFAQDAADNKLLIRKVKVVGAKYFAVTARDVLVTNIQQDGIWATGFVVAKAVEDGDPDVRFFVGHNDTDRGWLVAIEGQQRYALWLEQLPEPLRQPYLVANQALGEGDVSAQATAWVQQPELSFPWKTGVTWKLTGGPHNNSGINARPWSSLDFSPGTSGDWAVRAAAPGVVSLPCPNFILVTHINGWQTGYYHLSGIAVKSGQKVSTGTYLGKASAASGCGGSASGAHVHVSLRKSGVKQEWNNRYVGGFYVKDGTAQYNGYLKRVSDGAVVKQWSAVKNTGAVGLGTPGSPSLVAPINGVKMPTADFSWGSTYGVAYYRIEVDNNSDFSSPEVQSKPATTSFSTSALSSGKYYWRVRAGNFSHEGNWSSVRSFTLDTTTPPPPSPVVVNPRLSPAFGPTCTTAWYKVSGTGYNGTHVYLTLNTNQQAQSTNYGEWIFNSPMSGRYKIEAYIGHHTKISWPCPVKTISGDTSDAKYQIFYSGGSATKVINQLPLDNQWVSLGEYYFSGNAIGKVKLADLNGESNLSRTISYNVLRFTWVGP